MKKLAHLAIVLGKRGKAGRVSGCPGTSTLERQGSAGMAPGNQGTSPQGSLYFFIKGGDDVKPFLHMW